MKARRMKRGFCFTVAALFLVLALTAPPAYALDDDEFGGYASETLSIQVGYPGGPYYEKRLYTLSELQGMDVVCADYTFVDNMPSVIIDHVKGVRLSDIISGAGIELGAVNRFHFWIQDKKDSSYVTFSKASLIDTPRYCFYSLPDNFDYDEGKGNEYAGSDAQRVDTVMALADSWNRTIAGATFGSDFMKLNTNTRFRLIFGQTEPSTRTASQSAKWVYAIVAELAGSPTIALDVSELHLESGSTSQLKATVTAADPIVAEREPVVWTSSDEKVATVDKNGSVKARAAGSAVITAQFHGVPAKAAVNVTSAANGEAPSDKPEGGGGAAAEKENPVRPSGKPSGKPGGEGGAAASGTGNQVRPGGKSGGEGGPPADVSESGDNAQEKTGETPPESPARPSAQPESAETEPEPPAPIIGASAMALFSSGGIAVQLVSRHRARGGEKSRKK